MTKQESLTSSSVGVIIINWNSFDLLKRCLAALAVQEETINQTIIVDNGSKKPFEQLPCPRPENTRYIRLPHNVGFAKANNIAINQLTHCEWIALVNPDAFPEPGWLKSLMAATRIYAQYSIFACRMLRDDNPSILDGEGDAYNISGLVWRKGHGILSAKNRSYNNKEVFSPCAAAALYRRELLESVGGFDEDYFCYVEDVDLGFRMRLAGHRCMLVTESVVRHVGSATTGGSHSEFAIYHGHRNLVWTFIKDMPGMLFWGLLPLHLTMNLVVIVWFSFRGQGKIIRRAKWDAIKGIPKMWHKRKRIQSHRRASIWDIWRALDKSVYHKY